MQTYQMSRQYLTLNHYDGTLSGLRSMPAGPGDVVSPGGLATIQYHWTHGLGGPGDRTPDVFGGTGDRYVAGEYGNLYQPDAHASVHDYYYGPNTFQTKNQTLDGNPYYWNQETQNSSGIEKYTPTKNFELISEIPKESSIAVSNDISSPEGTVLAEPKKPFPVFALFVAVIIAFIVFDIWSSAAQSFIKQQFHGGKDISWQRYLTYAVVATVVLLGILYLLDIPLEAVETTN